jgi:Enoyl-(Acyl carrier protein) reductase
VKLADGLAKNLGKPREVIEAETASFHPLNRNATCEEVASVVLFLASQAASFITGIGRQLDSFWLATVPEYMCVGALLLQPFVLILDMHAARSLSDKFALSTCTPVPYVC